MIDLKKMLNICCAELDEIGIDYSYQINSITVNHRLSTTLGRCKHWGGEPGFSIEISGQMLREGVQESFLKSVIIHELIHTCPGCFNHGSGFQWRAEKVNRRFGYHVGTHASIEDCRASGIEVKRKKQTAAYRVECEKCGKVVGYRQRKCRVTDHPELYRCGICNGNIVIKINT